MGREVLGLHGGDGPHGRAPIPGLTLSPGAASEGAHPPRVLDRTPPPALSSLRIRARIPGHLRCHLAGVEGRGGGEPRSGVVSHGRTTSAWEPLNFPQQEPVE